MNVIKKKLPLIIKAIFLIAVFLLTIVPLRDPDIWFHLKSGQILSERGLIFYDVFSNSASGRLWIPYEWLFQIAVYHFHTIFGFEAIKYLMAAIITLQIGALYAILRKIFNLDLKLTFVLCFFFMVSVFEQLTARPHIPAYTLLLFNLFLIFYYYFKNKNLLWISLPATIIWANLHGSIFLDVALFGAYASLSLINYFIDKKKEWIEKFKTLTIYTVVTTVLTILPPLGFTQYQLLWRFFLERNTISRFIDEWTPLSNNPFIFFLVTITFLVSLLTFIFINFKHKSFKKSLWILPLLAFPLAAYAASRNVYLAYITFTIMLGGGLSQLNLKQLSRPVKWLFWSAIILLTILGVWLLYLKRIPQRMYFPVYATQFIQQTHLKGNMFNEYGAGGYLLYHLYPEQKIFYDGRTDVYLCCEMPDTLTLALRKNLSDNDYQKVVYALFDKYKISYAILRAEKNSVVRKIARILQNDPNWSLVFWDDDSQLFIKKDGKNDEIIKEFGTIAATPYNQNPFKTGTKATALQEYQRMIQVIDSAKSRNAIGYILLSQGKINEAKIEFEKAIALDLSDESPYMNLAEIAAHDNNPNLAIEYYTKAKELAPDRGLIYIRLGQLVLQQDNDLDQAKQIWTEGIKNTIDTEAKIKLRELLSKD